MIKVTINNICAKLTECEPLISGMIGKTLDVEFSADWNGLNKTAVFSNGDVTIDVLESQWSGNTITIPHEVLAKPNRTIVFGMYGFGVENGTVRALPTVYAKIGIPMVGADPTSDPTTDPSLPVYAQLQWQIDHFEIDEQQIAEQVQEYLETHPIEIQPATASVLGGVKVGEGLSVTADGTLSADAPDLSEYAKTADLDNLADIVDGKQDAISDLATIRSGAAKGETAVQPTNYASETAAGVVKTTSQFGLTTNYSTGVLMGVTKSAADYATAQAHMIVSKGTLDNLGLAKSADIPTAVSELTNDSGYLTLSTLPIYDGSVI